MAENCENEAIDNITSEVVQSHVKVVLTTHCIKAQIFLINKLKKTAEHNRETCNFISSTNYKLQSEINQANVDISSLLVAQDAVRMANIELKKDLLMAKERKENLIERIKNGERKCEHLWNESKARYESLHFVQKLLKAKDELQRLQKIMSEIEKEEKRYIEEIQVKKENCFNLDRKRVIELADFMVNVKPQTLAMLKKNVVAIAELKNDLEKLNQIIKTKAESDVSSQAQEASIALKTANDSALMIMPKLQLSGNLDFNVVSERIDEVTAKKADSFNKMPVKSNINYSFKCTINIHSNDITEDYISSYFNKPSLFYEETKPQNYSNKKFIHILDNVDINKITAQKIMEQVNPETLQPVDYISPGNHKPKETSSGLKFKGKKPLESDEIEEVDLTGSNADLLIPPTQFLDKSLEMQESQKEQEMSDLMPAPEEKLNLPQGFKEGLSKKRVSFDLPNTLETNIFDEIPEAPGEMDANETPNSQLNFSAVIDADDGFDNIKDMILKKHNLDSSPKFVYAKNVTTPSAVQGHRERVVTSKFFQQDQIISKSESEVEKKAITETDQPMEVVEINNNPNQTENEIVEDNEPFVEIDAEADTGPKPKKRKIYEQPDKPETGFLFSQAAQLTSESLDVSMNNTGFEDGDAEFPHCIDSSLLLSPKADLPPLTLTGESTVQSQDVPNFLSGIRKTGFSLFGCAPTSEPKQDANAQNPGGSRFSFNFGGEEKKSRGGLFSMFQ